MATSNKSKKILEKARKVAAKTKKKKVSKVEKTDVKKKTTFYPEGQNAPQSKRYTQESDKTLSAKATGWRWTKEGAKKVGKPVESKPTTSDIEKYRNETFKLKGKPNKSGPKGVGDGSHRYLYVERRADKSDLNKARKLELGGYNPDEMLKLKIEVDVYEDDYMEGEGKKVNSYKVNTYNDPNVKASDLVKYLSEEFHLSENPNDYTISSDGYIYTDQLVDADGVHVNDKATLERWKRGEKKLYNAHYTIYVLAVKKRIPNVKELSQATGIETYAKGGEMAKGGEVEDLRKRFEGYTDEELQIFNGDNKETLKHWNRKDAIEDAIKSTLDEQDSQGYMASGGKIPSDEVAYFKHYVKDFYGEGEIYSEFFPPVGVSSKEVNLAVNQYIDYCKTKDDQWGGGDTFDREIVRDIMLYNRGKKKGLEYQRAIKEIFGKDKKEYGGILQPMIGGVNADPRFDIYNTTMFAERGAELAKGGRTHEINIEDGDDVKFSFKKKTLLEIYESDDSELDNPVREIFNEGEVFEVTVFGIDKHKYDVQFGDGSVAFIRKADVNVIEVNGEKYSNYAKGGKIYESEDFKEWIYENHPTFNIDNEEFQMFIDEHYENMLPHAKNFQNLKEWLDVEYAKGGTTFGEFGSGRLNKNAWISANYIGDSKVKLGDLQSYLERNTNEDFDKNKIYTITRTLYKSGDYEIDDNKDWKLSTIYRKRKMAHGGSTHEQGYDDREDESLAMRHGKIARKHFVGSHARREHSRRDDAHFETRHKRAYGGLTDASIELLENGGGVGETSTFNVIYYETIPTRGGENLTRQAKVDNVKNNLETVIEQAKEKVTSLGYTYANIIDTKKGGIVAKIKKDGSIQKYEDGGDVEYARGGVLSHGFKTGDKILNDYLGYAIVKNTDGVSVVNPNSGSRFVISLDDSKMGGARKMIKMSEKQQIDAAIDYIDTLEPLND